MTTELEMVWRQLNEVVEAARVALSDIPDERLHWQPGPECQPASILAQHIARANVTYAHFMEFGRRPERTPYVDGASRDVVLQVLADSLEYVRGTFERMTPERLAETAADGWEPIGAEIEGPLPALWFAYTMLTHSAYHVGQMNTLVLLMSA